MKCGAKRNFLYTVLCSFKFRNMKALFNKKKKLAKQLNEIGYLLDREIEERWGFHYSQTDSDPIIDTLDYGTSDISYNDFVERMDDFKERENKGEWSPNA